jgi:hypothetical protein
MGQLDTEHEALEVRVLGREVVLLGKRISIALSAAAAAETARRLANAASIALASEPGSRTDSHVIPADQAASSAQASQTLPREE